MRKTIYAILTAFVTLLAVTSQSVYADRHGQDQEEFEIGEVIELLRSIRYSQEMKLERDVRVKEVPKATVINIDEAGAHLPLSQTILFIGPVNDDYYLIPFDNGSGGTPHRWLSGFYKAKYFGAPAGLKTFTLEVKVKDSAQHKSVLGTTHEYVVIFQEADANGPKKVTFTSPVHSGTTGSHGGGAHGNR